MRKILFLSILCITITAYSCDMSGYPSGARVYKGTCANCHLDQGEGLGALIPPLANSDYWNAHRDKLACIVRYGLADTIKVNGVTYQEKMLAMPGLSDIQITNVLNYIGSRWGNHTATFRLEEVRAMLKDCNSLPTGDTKTKQ
jgi:mono/diheme cytochrome c family protein